MPLLRLKTFIYKELNGFEPGPARTRAGGLTHASVFNVEKFPTFQRRNATGCVITGFSTFLKG